MADSAIMQWCKSVLKENGLDGWSVKQGEAYCWFGSREIHFDMAGDDRLNFLHEVAHALAPEPEVHGAGKHYHGYAWITEFHRLIHEHMDFKRWS